MKEYLKELLLALLILSIVGILNSCTALPSPDSGDGKIKNIHSEKPREKAPQVEKADLTDLVASNTRFAFDLYRAVRKPESNLIYSPYSISLALAMTYAGAEGETQQQMANTLHFALAQPRLHPTFNALDIDLANRSAEAEARGMQGFQLNIANSIWGQMGYDFLAGYLDLLAENYGAGLRLLDFQKSYEDSRLLINQWVSDETNGKIENLLPPGSISPDTRLILTNAIYFKAAWLVPFKKEETRDETFTLLDRNQITVPMMHGGLESLYAEGENYQAVVLPYEGNELSMIILLPQTGSFEAFEDSLSDKRLLDIIDSLKIREIILTMPKFSYTAEIDLKQKLSELGMPIAFTAGADFSGMNGHGNLMLKDVLHKAYISVNEAGTEAAASTAVIVIPTSMPPTVKVTLNHPFIFLIRDWKTGTVLFVGRVTNPGK
ncbi:serpin family protein [Candidatus Acetothermia bacterium]|nr:serpin family protein [Candidatus Acetothermia bacterium]